MKLLLSTNSILQYHVKRGISTSSCLYAKSKKKRVRNRSLSEEGRGTDRIELQVFMNSGKKFMPYDKNQEVTGKSVGPRREGGSKQAAALAAKHVVPEIGYINEYGRFIHVKEMQPNFVVPDLTDCKLRPYVSYRTADINQSKFTAAELYKSQVKETLEKDYKRIEMGVPVQQVIYDRMRIMDEEDRLQREVTDEKDSQDGKS